METTCPHCGRVNDCQSDVGGTSVPKDGDVSLCFNCAGLGIYDSSRPGGVYIPDPTEMVALMADEAIVCAVAALKLVKGETNDGSQTTH